MTCRHENFAAAVAVGRIVDVAGQLVGSYTVEVTAHCVGCGKPLQFQGLPIGLDTHGPTRSPNGQEARLVAVVQDEPSLVTDRISAIFRQPGGRA